MNNSIEAFIWGVLIGAGFAIILLGHNGILEDPQPVAHPVSPRMMYVPGDCVPDWPQYAKVCTYLTKRGNVIRHTHF